VATWSTEKVIEPGCAELVVVAVAETVPDAGVLTVAVAAVQDAGSAVFVANVARLATLVLTLCRAVISLVVDA
jgi:hypothetical protein